MNKVDQISFLEAANSLQKGSYNIIIADPPYNIGKDFGNDSDKQDMSDYFKWTEEWVSLAYDLLSPSGSMYIYGFSEILATIFHNIPANEKRWLVWHYTNKTVPSLNYWQRTHESIIHVWKDPRVFNRDLVREPYTDTFLKNAAGKKRKPTKGRFSSSDKETTYTAHKSGALPRDVIKSPALSGGAGKKERYFYSKKDNKVHPPSELKNHSESDIIKHPTQKPFALTEKLIKSCYSPEGDNKALVPFAGSGSECVVLKEMGIDFNAYEINPAYVKLANGWLNLDGQLKLL